MADSGDSQMHHHSNYKLHVSTNVSDWLFVAGMGIMIICLLWMNISLFFKLRTYFAKNKRDHWRGHKSVILITVSIVALTLVALFSCISTVMVLIYSDFHHALVINDILIKLSLGLYSGCQTLMIYVFTVRVDTVFSDTSVSVGNYPRNTVKFLYISCLLFGALYIFFMITLIFELWSLYYIVAIIWIVLYFVLSSTLCTLFIRKVEVLMVNASAIDPELLHVILKSGILVPMSICSSFVFFMVMICIIYVLSPGQWNPAGIFWIVVDCTVSAICLFLLFASNNDSYNTYCWCIHQSCEKRKVSGIEKKMMRREASVRGEASRTKSRTRTGTTETQTQRTETISSQAASATMKQVLSESVLVTHDAPRLTPDSTPLPEPSHGSEILNV
eukprot:2214_1